MRRIVSATLVTVLLGTSAVQMQAQAAAPPSPPRLFTVNDLYLLGGFTALTVAMWPIDERAALKLQRDPVQNRRLYSTTADFFRILGAPTSLITGVGMYGVGRLAKQPRLADFGLHITESMVLASVVTQAAKGFAGRARPYRFVDSTGVRPFDPNPRDFKFNRGWRGGSGLQSMPSGHASAAFAFASGLVAEINRWKPGWTWWAGPIFYGGATMVALSRMYNNAHWASDVTVGAAIGTFAGLKIVRLNHNNPGNRIDRVFLGASVVTTGPGAAQIRWTLTPQFDFPR